MTTYADDTMELALAPSTPGRRCHLGSTPQWPTVWSESSEKNRKSETVPPKGGGRLTSP